MKKASKRILTCLLGVCMSATALLSTSCSRKNPIKKYSDLITEIGGCSETYQGTVSEKTYNTAEAAISGYITEEMTGGSEETAIIKTKSKGTLSKKEIDTLNLSAEDLKEVQSIEKYQVSYSGEKSPNSKLLAKDAETKTRKDDVVIIVISYGDYFKYFSPVVKNGNTVTKSYYDSIFNAEKYKNCTMESHTEIGINMTPSNIFVRLLLIGEDEDMSYNGTLDVTSKYDDNKIYQSQRTDLSDMDIGNMEVYIETNPETKKTTCYEKDNGNWYEVSLHSIGFDSVSELTPFAKSYLDHTYFTKTEYGCTIAEENLKQYYEAVFSDIGDEMNASDFEVKGSVDYFVSDGVLSAIAGNITCKFKISSEDFDFNTELSIVFNEKCINYGTTVVEK